MDALNSPYKLLASIDLGSNSFRLQIARVVDGQLYTLDSIKETVRFAAGLSDDKILDTETQKKALTSLARFGERLRGFAPEQVRVVGTSTLRVAKNIGLFIQQAEAVLGFPVEVIAGREEARLVYLGVAHRMPASHESRLVVDIGGGSTEFALGSEYTAHVTESLPLGCISYTMRFFKKGQITEVNFQNAILAARNEIQRIAQRFSPDKWQVAIGSSGTVRSLRDIFTYQEEATTITLHRILALKNELTRQGKIKTIRLAGLKADRTPVLPGGLAIMIAIFEELDIQQMQVNDASLRDGVLYDLLGRQNAHDVRDLTVTQFKRRYHVDGTQAERVMYLAETFYFMLMGKEAVSLTLHKQLLWAAQLHEVGLSISHAGYHKHSAYILQQADMPGFSRSEQTQLATMVLGHRGDIHKMKQPIRTPGLGQAIVALRLAVLFYRRRIDVPLPSILNLEQSDNRFTLTLSSSWLEDNPLTAHAFRQEVNQWDSLGFQLKIVQTETNQTSMAPLIEIF